MPAALNKQKGFSMVEVLLAMMLLVVVVTALSGYHRALAARFATLNQYRQLWHNAWSLSQLSTFALPAGWQASRLAGQPGADNARQMCQHHGHTYFSSGATRRDDASALPG